MLFGLIKSNDEKIKELFIEKHNELLKYSFNNHIRTFNGDDFKNLCEEAISKEVDYSMVQNKLIDYKKYNKLLKTIADEFNKIRSNHEEPTYIDSIIVSFTNASELIENYQETVNFIKEEIIEKRKFEEELFKVREDIYKFNKFHQNLKFVDIDLEDCKFKYGDNDANRQVQDTFNKVKNYIAITETLENNVDNNIFLPVIEDEKNIRDKWLVLEKKLNFEEYNIGIQKAYIEDLEILDTYSCEHAAVMGDDGYVVAINKLMTDFAQRMSANKAIEKIFIDEYNDINCTLRQVKNNYRNRNYKIETIKNDLKNLKNRILKMHESYTSLITPISNTLKMLDIESKKEIEDINDYYIYSVSKSIENKLNIYGKSKKITQQEVDYMISLIESKLYVLTTDQKKAIIEAVVLLNTDNTVSCLIQGDVSSGKTIVTVALMFILALKKMKSVYIIPRKILKLQHLKTLRKYNELLGLNLNIVDSSQEFNIEEVDIVLNGYSFNKNIFSETEFHLGVVDEIQLFGVEQRKIVQTKYPNIDMFYTTATPHPRTKLISLIGNMDILEIKEMPPGRKLKHTEAFKDLNQKHFDLIRSECGKGQLTIVICPLVNKAGHGSYESIKVAYDTYQKIFPELKVVMLLSNMSEDKKDRILEDCNNGEIDILIATKSIEVGVDIPRASVIIIHYPYTTKIKWGASQLHQLRGRVGRQNQDSYCYIECPHNVDEKSPIGSVLKTQDVFKLTQDDFDWRGFEKIIGTKQSGTNGSKLSQEKRIKAYETIAKSVPKMMDTLEGEFLDILKKALEDTRVENLN